MSFFRRLLMMVDNRGMAWLRNCFLGNRALELFKKFVYQKIAFQAICLRTSPLVEVPKKISGFFDQIVNKFLESQYTSETVQYQDNIFVQGHFSDEMQKWSSVSNTVSTLWVGCGLCR